MGGVPSQLLRVRGKGLKVASENFQGVFFPLDFSPGADAKTAHEGDREGRAFKRMLKQNSQDAGGEDKPFPIDHCQEKAAQGEGGSVGLQTTLEVPFLFQLLD